MNKKASQKYVNRIEGHALVLGGSGGIGREIVLALAASGARAISFTYNNREAVAKKLAKKLRGLGVKKVHFTKINYPTTDSQVPGFKRFLEEVVGAMGEEIAVAINTIGISPNQALEKQKIEGHHGWRHVYDVNVFGSFLSTRVIIERMARKKIRGSVTLITSTNGINSQAEYSAHYDSSKAAQAHKMLATAEETARKHGIRLNGIAPGWVETAMNDSLPPGEKKKETKKIWLRRFADPSEIAKVAVFVAGTGGSYIVGKNLMVDGGYR